MKLILCPCLLLLACDSGEAPDAARIPYEGGSVAGTLDKLVEADARRRRKEEAASRPVSAARVEMLDQRVSQLELALSEIQTTGVLPASTIAYDPRATTLSAQDVQSAITELHTAIKALQESMEEPMGEPGPGLWTQVHSGGPGPKGQGGQLPPGGQPPPGGPGGQPGMGPPDGQAGMGPPPGGDVGNKR